MKRFHVHAHVDDRPTSVAFHAESFGNDPTRIEDGCSKWLLDEPRVLVSSFASVKTGMSPSVWIEVFRQIRGRVSTFVALPFAVLDRHAIERELDAIGRDVVANP